VKKIENINNAMFVFKVTFYDNGNCINLSYFIGSCFIIVYSRQLFIIQNVSEPPISYLRKRIELYIGYTLDRQHGLFTVLVYGINCLHAHVPTKSRAVAG
jgi:hypothetical protein